MAEEDGRLPSARAPGDVPAMIGAQNFKGGVGQSTVTTQLAHYCAVKGYRVLVVDCDSQAATTALFTFNPHFKTTQEETLVL
jgi:chromosome partitioning protein